MEYTFDTPNFKLIQGNALEVLKEWLKNFKIPYLRDEINRLSDKEWEEI